MEFFGPRVGTISSGGAATGVGPGLTSIVATLAGQKLLAIVVIGGSLSLALLTRLLPPPLLVLVHRWPKR